MSNKKYWTQEAQHSTHLLQPKNELVQTHAFLSLNLLPQTKKKLGLPTHVQFGLPLDD